MDEIKLYAKHKKEVERHVLLNITKLFDMEDVVSAAVHMVLCKAIDEKINPADRSVYIHKEVDKQIKRWVG
jgi:type III secretory pathway lipoprotein EscJ